jgi:hypothetical protein
MPMIEALKEEIAFQSKHPSEISYRPDYEKFSGCSIPAVLIKHPAMLTEFIICADASLSIVDSGRYDEDFDDLSIPSENVLVNAGAFDKAFDALANIAPAGEYAPSRPSGTLTCEGWALIGITVAARRLLAVPDDMPLEEVSAFCRQNGGDAECIRAAIDAYSSNLDDPLFVPEAEKNWSDKDAEEVAEIVTDILNSDPNFNGGGVDLTVTEDGEGDALEIDYEPVPKVSVRAFEILNVLCNFDERFTGKEWEYNDGAYSRQSGYYDQGATLFAHDFAMPSNHERLAARRRLIERLQAKDIDSAAIDALLEPGQET